ncbi:MAG: rod shape-determining protein RodA [Bacteroidota bacterium]
MARSRRKYSLANVDWPIFSIFLSLIAVGWLTIYSVDFDDNLRRSFFSTAAGKQSIFMVLSIGVFFLITLIEWKFWQTFAYLFYIFSIILLISVLFFGSNIKGATSWYSFGFFSFQPSEIAKFGTCLAMAAYLSNSSSNLRDLRIQLSAFSIFLLPIALILLQPDMGSALVFLAFLVPMFREGLSINYFLIGSFLGLMCILGFMYDTVYVSIGLLWVFSLAIIYNLKTKRRWLWIMLTIGLFAMGYFLLQVEQEEVVLFGSIGVFVLAALFQWIQTRSRLPLMLSVFSFMGIVVTFTVNYAFNNILKPHQQDRINVWLRPELCDPKGSLYNLIQSQMAISSGGLQGKGFLNGTMTKLNYVPEQTTDFIFCTIGEEHGFLGSFGIIALFFLLLYRITFIAERQRSKFSRIYAYGLAGILFIHWFINIGMTMGLVPVVGIPLPFISKGGSSLLGFTVMLAVLIKFDSHRDSP